MAVEYGVPCITSLDTAKLLVRCVKLERQGREVEPLGLHELIL